MKPSNRKAFRRQTRFPWKITGEKTVFSDKQRRVFLKVFDVIRPDGLPGKHSILEVPKGVAIVPIDKKGNILLVGQWRFVPEKFSWEIPGGTQEEKETALQCAKRELKEETGLTAKRWTKLGFVCQRVDRVRDIVTIFLAQNLAQGHWTPSSDEIRKRKWVPLDQAVKMADNNQIIAAHAAIAIYKAESFLRNKR